MKGFIALIAFVAIWYLLQAHILPRMGVST